MNGLEVLLSWLTPTILFCILNLMIAIIFILNSHKKQSDPVHHPSQFVRVPSLFERVKSINISMYRADPQPDPVHHTTLPAATEEPVHKHEEIGTHVTRSKSDTIPKEMKLDATMLKKSASEKLVVEADGKEEVMVDRRRPATVRERTSLIHREDEAVDEKADDFINRFRQQLKLQRLDSIVRYKEMLNRGIGR